MARFYEPDLGSNPDDPFARDAEGSPVVQIGKNRAVGQQIDGMDRLQRGVEIDEDPRGIMVAPGQTTAPQLPEVDPGTAGIGQQEQQQQRELLDII